MDTKYTPLDSHCLALSQCWYPLRRTMGLCRTWIGRILSLGSDGKCVIHAMADKHGISPFCDDSGKKRHAQSLEHGLDHFDLCPFYLWHISYAEWSDFFCACFRTIFAWSLFFAVSRCDISCRCHFAGEAFATVTK